MADNLNFANFARSVLSADAEQEAVQISVEDGSLFPEGLFTAVVWSAAKGSPLDDPESEIMLLSVSSEGGFDAVRGLEGTSARSWQAGSNIANAVTAETMEYLWSSASVAASVSEISANIYEMQRGDTNSFFTFENGESYKTVTLPESVLTEGLTYRINNRGGAAGQNIRLYPSAGDSYSHTSDTYMAVTSGSSAALTCLSGVWTVTEYRNASIGGIKKIDTSYTAVSMADGTVFADASEGNIFLTLSGENETAGMPLTVIKYDDTENFVYFYPFADYPYTEILYGQLESVTMTADEDGGIRLLNRYTPQSIKVREISAHTTLLGHEQFVMVNTGDADIAVYLPQVERMKGEAITVKKTDSGTGRILVTGSYALVEGVSQYPVSGQNSYASFASDGFQWQRVG